MDIDGGRYETKKCKNVVIPKNFKFEENLKNKLEHISKNKKKIQEIKELLNKDN
jgi:hypothetical protein